MTSFVRYDIERSIYNEDPFTDSSPGLRAVYTVTEQQELPDDGIFVFKKIKTGYSDEDAAFSHIASAVDMEDFPYGTPDPDSVWFRTNVLDLVFHTEDEAAEVQTLVDEDIRVLTTGVDRTNDLDNPEEVTVPSEQTSTTPGGTDVGTGDPTLSISFPVALAAAPSGRVLVSITPSISFKVTAVTASGFDLASNVNITSGHTVRWQVVSA